MKWRAGKPCTSENITHSFTKGGEVRIVPLSRKNPGGAGC
jgi:hypothetical protein